MKRAIDFLVSGAGLLLLCPALLLLCVLVAMKMGMPVIFKQARPGLNGRLFELYKIRTMTEKCDDGGNLLVDNLRLTELGRFLRSTSLDELPTLVNVLKGDMSLVGPRPLLVEYLDKYTPMQARRHEVRPGITGWAQVNGRNTLGWEEKFDLDVWYVENQSFILDCKIILLTVWKVILREGISQQGEATMKAFTGTKKLK